MVSLLVIAWQRLLYTNVKTCDNFLSQVVTDRTIKMAWAGVATRALNPEDMGALERAEGGENRGRGRGGFDRGMMRGGGGMRGGMSRGGMG